MENPQKTNLGSPSSRTVAVWILPGAKDQETLNLKSELDLQHQLARFENHRQSLDATFDNVRLERMTQTRLFTSDMTLSVRRIHNNENLVSWKLERPALTDWKTHRARRPEKMMERLLGNVNPNSVRLTETTESYKLMVGNQFLGEMILITKSSSKVNLVRKVNNQKPNLVLK